MTCANKTISAGLLLLFEFEFPAIILSLSSLGEESVVDEDVHVLIRMSCFS